MEIITSYIFFICSFHINYRDFDDLPLAEVGTYRFVNSQLPQQTPRNPSPTDFLEPRPPCARELDVCSYSHDYPTYVINVERLLIRRFLRLAH